jgi:hypothetical protein
MGQAPIDEKLQASRDLGLTPLVRWFFAQIDRHFVQRLHPDFELVPVGLGRDSATGETELLTKQTAVYLTVDEARQEVGKAPLPDGRGEVILNPTWLQFAQGKDAAAQGMGPGGPEDGPGGPGPDDDGDNEDDDGPTGGLGVADKNGNPFSFDDEEDDADEPGSGAVAKSVSIARYEVPLNPVGGLR